MIADGKMLPVRKRPVHLPNVERHNQPVIIFVTVCTYQRKGLLASEAMYKMLVEAWGQATSHRVGCYMIMPDHIHLFCSPTQRESESVQRWVGYWKRMVSGGLDSSESLWQRDCWDTQLRDVAHYGDKWQYVLQNPVRRGLVSCVADWEFKGMIHELRW